MRNFSLIAFRLSGSQASIFKSFCTVAFLLLIVIKSSAQVGSYAFSESITGTPFTPLTGGVAAYSGAWDDHTAGNAYNVALGFNFVYDGVAFNNCFISPNGFITFGSTAQPLPNNYTPINTNTLYNPTSGGAISALGTDLISGGFDIIYQTLGAAPNRTFVIEWKDVLRKAIGGTFNFQIRLSETTNIIQFSYGLCQPATTTNSTVQLGLRGLNNITTQGNTLSRSQGVTDKWFSFTNNGVAASVVNTNVDSYPNLNLLYTFTPPAPCISPTAQPTNLVLGATSIGHNAITGNSFTASVPAASKYLVLMSSTNTPPTAAIIANRTYYDLGVTYSGFKVMSNSVLTSFSANSLLPNQTYYFWVIPFSDKCLGSPFYNLTSILTGSATTCSTPTVLSAPTAVSGNSFTLNWSTVAGVSNYVVDVATNPTFTVLVPGYAALSMGNITTTLAVSGLLPFTTYYCRVRAVGAGCVLNSNVVSTTTTCGFYTIPYAQNFDGTAVGAMPSCFVVNNVNADGQQWSVNNLNFASASKSVQINSNPLQDMNDWFFVPGLNLVGGTSYRLFFRYNTGSTSSKSENLQVFYGANQTIAGMTTSLLTISSFSNTLYTSTYADFTPPSSGIYYIGFQGLSLANQSYIVIDDIRVTVSPTCIEPTEVNISAITSSSATISWDPANPLPAVGYDYYISTSSTNPITTTIPTATVAAGINTVNLTGLIQSSNYYVWVRSNCGPSDKSVWTAVEYFNTECSVPTLLSTTPVTRCGYGTANLSATSSIGSTIRWYDSPTGTTILATGTNYPTDFISTTTTYYVDAISYGVTAKVGAVSPLTQTGTLGVQIDPAAVTFSVLSTTKLQSIDVYPIVSGQAGRVSVRNSSNITIAQINFTTTASGGSTPQIIPINFGFEAGDYSLYFEIVPTSGVRMNTSNANYPYQTSVASITGNSIDGMYYLGFYNWKFTTQCVAPRIPIVATVTPPPSLTLSETNVTICEDFSSDPIIVSGYAAYSSLVWIPNTNISGNFTSGFTFNPTTTTTYTLVGNQASGSFCGNRVTLTVNVNAAPPLIAIIPPAPTICYNDIQPLYGSTSITNPSVIIAENFNATTNNWVVANTSVGGNTLASQWALYQSGYHYIAPYWNVTFFSNDNTQFCMANSDAQSSVSGPMTQTTLTSPSFSLAGYTTANLNYWHYLRYTDYDSFLVQVSIDNGATWTTLKSYKYTQGTAVNFVNDGVNLNAFLGNPNVKVRYNFIAPWTYVWAVDNITISGTLSAALSWNPITELYSDTAATIPYVAGTALSVVYAKPTSTRTYTATITASNSCTRSNTATITVSPQTVGGILSSNQVVCGSIIPDNIVLSGNTGNVIRWEQADDVTFTTNLVTVANTTATLTAAEIGFFANSRFYRAVLKSGVCNEAYSSIVSVSFPTTVWNGLAWSNGLPNSTTRVVFNGNYNPATDLTLASSSTPLILKACSVFIQSGVVTFPANYVLDVDKTVNSTLGSLIFENTASLVQSNDVVNPIGVYSGGNVGNITYRRMTNTVGAFDYTYWSTPVWPQTLTNMSPDSPNSFYFFFNPILANWVNINSNNLMEVGKGYIIRAPYYANNTTGYNSNFIGVPNSGTITTPIQIGPTTATPIYREMNLIGNPYPSAISAISFLTNSLNTNVVDATMYFWTHNTPITANLYNANDYAMFNYSGSVASSPATATGINNAAPNGYVASGQSFFIKGINSGGVATFQNNMRGSTFSNTQFYRSTATTTSLTENAIIDLERNRFWLDVYNTEGAFKQTMIGYIEQATNEFDRGFDGLTFNSGNVINFYSVLDPTTLLGIQGKALPFLQSDVVPLGYSTTLNGGFSVKLSNYDTFFNTQNIYLKDKVLNVIHDLKLSDYSFTTTAGTFNDRFEIVYQNPLHTTDFNDTSVVVFKANNLLNIKATNKVITKVALYDIRGRLILSKNNINTSEIALDSGTVNQVLLVQITTDDGILVTKKYIN